MKLATFNELQVGDKVTVRTVEELLSLKGVKLDHEDDLVIPDEKTRENHFIMTTSDEDRNMAQYCGQTFEIAYVSKHFSCVRMYGAGDWNYTRKMLRDEVVKNEEK